MIFGSKEYQALMMSKLEPGSEKTKKGDHPKANGLWNLCVREVGMLSSYTKIIESPQNPVVNTDTMTATVVVTVELSPYFNRYMPVADFTSATIEDSQRVLSNDVRTFEGACNIGKYNTSVEDEEGVFHLFTVATAESIALGRALKKALALNCHTAEEVSTDINKLKGFNYEKPPVEMITDAQKRAVVKKAAEIKIDLEKYLVESIGVNMFEFEGSSLIKEKAEKILTDFNNWSINPKKIPKEYRNV